MRWFLSLGIVLVGLLPAGAVDHRNFEDATLHAVQFVDASEGWAVGEEGCIWHTIDGGKNWERQPTGVQASLRSLYFLTPLVGWVVGREDLPNQGGSVGVVLFTRDGGATWERQRRLTNALPGLHQIKFVDPYRGIMLGDGSEQYPSGLFRTTDGGKGWEPVKGSRSPGWLAADFQDANNGIFVGPWAHLASMRGDEFLRAEIEAAGGRSVRAVQILPRRIVAVGDGGMILSSISGGTKWGFAKLNLPQQVLACLDFHAIAAVRSRAWGVGRPGSFVLTTDDGGDSWKMKSTGQPLPLHGVWFIDEKRGWAVGSGGTILGTTDGGESWTIQRQGAKRAGVLLVHARGSDVPIDTLALLGADQGYLTGILQVTSADPASASPGKAFESLRLKQATRRAGGLSAESLWQFPLPQHLADTTRANLLAYWNERHGNQAAEEILRQLVLSLRLWRPTVVLTDALEGHPAGMLLAEALKEAVRQAGDDKVFPEQIKELGLVAWKPAKLFALAGTGSATIVQDNQEPHPRLEGSAAEFAFGPANLLKDQPTSLPAQRRFVRLDAEEAPHAHWLDNLNSQVEEARRKVVQEELPTAVRQALNERRNLVLLAEKLQDADKVLGVIDPLLAKLSEEQAAPAAFAIANHYARRGQWQLAREAFLLMVDRFPAHPLSADAYRWLIRHNSSSEARRRNELEQVLSVKHVGFQPITPNLPPAQKDGIQQAQAIQTTSNDQRTLLGSQETTRQWYRGSLEIGRRLASFGPLYASDPPTQFCLQSAQRNLGDFAGPQEWYGKFKDWVGRGPWHDAAAAELWLNNRSLPAPRKVAMCRLATERPYLDGKFDDPCWQGLKPMVLADAVGQTQQDYPSIVLFAYDQEFLYVALRCQHPAGRRVAPSMPRPRDGDLRPFDRVSLLFDLDRDYSTYYHLQVDQRGWVREDCWGDTSWNPKWFVAVHSTDDFWQIEAAIPLGELTGERITLNTSWACNISRVLPGRGVQSFSQPADVEPRPEGMCLLLFYQDPAKAAPPMSRPAN